VPEPRRGQMDQILFVDGTTLGTEVVEHRLDIHGISHHHGIGQEIETHCLIRLGFLVFAANDAHVGDEEEIPQGVEGFTFIELGIDTAAVLFNGLTILL
jgi:hypothetical protein